MVVEVSEKRFIDEVESLLAKKLAATETIKGLDRISRPQLATELTQLIMRLPADLQWEADYTYDYLSDEDMVEPLEKDAKKLVEALESYVRDFRDGNFYHTEYELHARYRGLHHRAYDWKSQTKPLAAKTMDEAKRLAADWQTDFAERTHEEKTDDEFKLDSVDIVAKIIDAKNELLGSSKVVIFEAP